MDNKKNNIVEIKEKDLHYYHQQLHSSLGGLLKQKKFLEALIVESQDTLKKYDELMDEKIKR